MRPKKSINFKELIRLVPKQFLNELAQKTKVNHSVSKLTGEVMFTLFLYGLTSTNFVSLRILEQIFNSPIFKLQRGSQETTRHSAIGERLKKMKVSFFKNIFESLASDPRVDLWFGSTNKKYIIRKIDSTIVNLSAELLHLGLHINQEKRDLKFTLDLTNSLPINIKLFTNQTYASEDKALPEVIEGDPSQNLKKIEIILFDRGVHKIATYDQIAQTKNSYFITRLSGQSYEVVRINKKIKGRKSGDLILESDELIRFSSKRAKSQGNSDRIYRLITSLNAKSNQQIKFLTNIDFLNASEIATVYKSRWEIETFFKFIKQQLNFSHLVSRSRNGIKIMMYMTMIAAILVAIYKKINKIESWTIAKMRFFQEMEMNIIETFFEELVSMFINSKKIPMLFNSS